MSLSTSSGVFQNIFSEFDFLLMISTAGQTLNNQMPLQKKEELKTESGSRELSQLLMPLISILMCMELIGDGRALLAAKAELLLLAYHTAMVALNCS